MRSHQKEKIVVDLPSSLSHINRSIETHYHPSGVKTIFFDIASSETIMITLSIPVGYFDEDLS